MKYIDLEEVTRDYLDKIHTLDDFMKYTQPIGSVKSAITNNLYGINHRKIKGILPKEKDDFGYTFFTRPQLNLSSGNIRNLRVLYPLLNNKESSIYRYVRCMLDPRLQTPPADLSFNHLKSTLVDPLSAFIPLLTNTVTTVSGWPDITMDTFTSKAGVRKEQYTQADGTTDIYEAFDLDIGFDNIKESPGYIMFTSWLYYMGAVFEGMMSPYPDFLSENELDYNTRIYRLVMTEDKRRVKKIAATGASFPINVPTGQSFDYSDKTPFNEQNNSYTIRMRSVGAMYNDEILKKEFNETVAIFNPSMRSVINTGKSTTMKEIPINLLTALNYRGYPMIDLDTNELKWFIDSNKL